MDRKILRDSMQIIELCKRREVDSVSYSLMRDGRAQAFIHYNKGELDSQVIKRCDSSKALEDIYLIQSYIKESYERNMETS